MAKDGQNLKVINMPLTEAQKRKREKTLRFDYKRYTNWLRYRKDYGYVEAEPDEEYTHLFEFLGDCFDPDEPGTLKEVPELFQNLSMYTSHYPRSAGTNVSVEENSFGTPRECHFICVNDLSDPEIYGDWFKPDMDYYDWERRREKLRDRERKLRPAVK